MCVNSDGNYAKAMQNTAELVAKIMKDEGIQITNVVQHNYFSGKNCPRNVFERENSWSQFLEKISACQGTTQQPELVTDTNKCVMTGTYSTLQAAENVLDVLEQVAYIKQDSTSWRVKTGTFIGMDAALAGANKIKTAKLEQVTNLVQV